MVTEWGIAMIGAGGGALITIIGQSWLWLRTTNKERIDRTRSMIFDLQAELIENHQLLVHEYDSTQRVLTFSAWEKHRGMIMSLDEEVQMRLWVAYIALRLFEASGVQEYRVPAREEVLMAIDTIKDWYKSLRLPTFP